MRDLKKELSQLTDLKNEIRLLEDHEKRLREQLFEINQRVKFDSVQGSSPEFPFTFHSFALHGMADTDLSAKYDIRQNIADIKTRIANQKARCAAEYKRLMGFIQTVDDSRMRQILMLRYIDGIEHWNDIAARMGPKESKDGVRMALDRFLKNFS
jgi:hypothetical protein